MLYISFGNPFQVAHVISYISQCHINSAQYSMICSTVIVCESFVAQVFICILNTMELHMFQNSNIGLN